MAIQHTGDRYSIINYTDLLKISGSRITDIETFRDKIYLATETGLVYFDPRQTAPFQTAPKIRFGEIKVNNRLADTKMLTDLKYNENDISIAYSGLSYFSGDNIHYQYYLSGYDQEWHTTVERSIQFKSLPPGNYRFLVKAKNKAGITSPVQSIAFTIDKPVWLEWWFLLLSALWIVIAIILFLKFRLIRMQSNYDQQQRTMRLEMDKAESDKMISELNQQAFRQQMNPHFIFNALNTIKGYYAENNIKQASEYISKFSKLLRNILENSEQVIPLEREVMAIQLYLELAAMRYENKFTYSIDHAADLPVHEVGIPPMLIQPFIENALVHGIAPLQGKGHIRIHFNRVADRLECHITDDGIGRQEAAGRTRLMDHSSKATLLITEYLKALNRRAGAEAFTLQINDMRNETGDAAGTEVILRMPILNP